MAIIKHEFTKSDDDGDEEGSLTASATKTPGYKYAFSAAEAKEKRIHQRFVGPVSERREGT